DLDDVAKNCHRYRVISFGIFFYRSGHHRDLHSFPTRRSSDLWTVVRNIGKNVAYVMKPTLDSSPMPIHTMKSGSIASGGIGRSRDRKSTRLNSSHVKISYAVFCLKKKNNTMTYRKQGQNNREQ